jgi:hypothetical protein
MDAITAGDSLTEVAALRMLRMISPEDVGKWAAEQVSESSLQSLVPIAAMSRGADSIELDGLLDAALLEAGCYKLDDDAARLIVGARFARQILEGTVAPMDGARALWGLAVRKTPGPTPFDDFIAAASGWEDEPDHRAEYERDVLEAARRFLRDRNPETPVGRDG